MGPSWGRLRATELRSYFRYPRGTRFFHLDGRTILIEKDLIGEGANQGRYHFTLYARGMSPTVGADFPRGNARVKVSGSVLYGGAAEEDYWEEWRANTLASAILMPLEMIRHNMEEFGLGEKIQTLNRIYFPKVYDNFCRMAEYMGVSLQALSIRLSHLGLLKNNYLENPYRMVDIFPD